jgi:hypothetical protein
MGLIKEGKAELLKIQKALAAVGYYAYRLDMMAGHPIETIHVRPFSKEHDDELMLCNEEILALLPDDADYDTWVKACLSWEHRKGTV